MAARVQHVGIEMLGRFRVVLDGGEVAEEGWPGRRAAELVQLLALHPGHRLLCDQVVEALWPHLDPRAGAANLRKAAHYARRALGGPEAVVLRGGAVALFPLGEVETDVEWFERRAGAAIRTGDRQECAAAAALFTGNLLPGGLYEEWTQAPREHLRLLYKRLLRGAGLWERLVEVDPTDEPAYRELMRAALASGNRHEAIRWYGRCRAALQRELAVAPDAQTTKLYDECVAGLRMAVPALVGRDVELARATAVLGSAGQGNTGALVVRGPAGIGKSALCRQIAPIGRTAGWVVATVTAAWEAEPYAPLAAALEQLVAGDCTLLDRVSLASRAVLAELTPLASPAPAPGGPLTRHRVIGAVRRLVQACGDASGVLVIVDDAHLADDATLDALLQLAGSSAPVPLLVVLAYRMEPRRPALARHVARMERAGRAVTLDLAPLDREDASALAQAAAASPPTAEVLSRIVEMGQGNPFFTVELARGVVVDAPLAIPATRWDAVTARFVDLDEGTVALLQRLAVAGDGLDLTSVLALTDLAEPEAFALLDSALAAGVLVVEGTEYRFRHELVRQALVGRLAPHRQVAVHRDAARRLAKIHAAPAVIARHWLQGGRPDEATEWLLAAARHAVRLGAYADALGHLDTLLAHAADHPDALCLRADVLNARGDARAPAAFAAAANIIGEPESSEIRAKQALAQLKSGDPGGALRTLDGLEPRTPAGRLSQALALSGAAAVGFGDPRMAADKAAEVRRLARELDDPGATVEAAWAQSLAAHALGDLPARLQADLHATNDLPELAIRVFDGHLCATERLLYGARPYAEVIAFADALAAQAERLGAARGYGFAVTLRGEARLLSGRLDEADADLADGARQHRAIGAAAGEALALQRRAEVALYAGRTSQAHDLLDEALAAARESYLGQHLLDRIYGTKAAAAVEPAAALGAVEEAEAAVRGPAETCPACRITLLVPAAIAAVRAGDHTRASAHAEHAGQLATAILRQPGWLAAVDEVRGQLALAAGDHSAAAAHFQVAADGFGGCGQLLDESRCRALTRSCRSS